MGILGGQSGENESFSLRRKRTARQRYGPVMRLAGSGPPGSRDCGEPRLPDLAETLSDQGRIFNRGRVLSRRRMTHAAATRQILPAAVRGAEFYPRRTALQCRPAD